jgi:hypothetical protein
LVILTCSQNLQPIQLQVEAGDLVPTAPPAVDYFDPIVYAKNWPVDVTDISPNNPIVNSSTTDRVIDPQLTLHNPPITQVESYSTELLNFPPYNPANSDHYPPSSRQSQLPLTVRTEAVNSWKEWDIWKELDPLDFIQDDNLFDALVTTEDMLPGAILVVGQKRYCTSWAHD